MASILVLDDSPAMLEFLSGILKDNGYETYTLAQPSLLLPCLEKNVIDLILLDIYMPEIDGLTLLKDLKESSIFHNIEVIMISAISDEHIVAECFLNGASDFVAKPFNEVILLSKISSALDRVKHREVESKLSRSIHELTESEHKLTQSTAHYDAIVKTSMDGIISIDEGARITSFNPAAEKLFGYLSQEVMGKNINLLMPQREKELHNHHIKNHQKTGSKEVIGTMREVLALRKDGSTFPIELSVSEICYGLRKGYAGIIRDISERTMAKEAIVKVSDYLDAILLNLPVGVAIFEGRELRYFRINQYLADLNGASVDAHLGKRLTDIIPEAKDTLLPDLQNVMATGQAITHREFSLELVDEKNPVHLIDWHVPLFAKNGDVSGIISVVLDVSELRDTQHQLQQSQKLESLGKLAGGIAHDFNNTLAVVMASAELALPVTAPANRRQIERIIEASEKSEAIIKQILTFSRMELVEFKAIDPISEIKEAVEMLGVVLPSNIDINLQLCENCPIILGDKTNIHQIIINICTNAFQAMRDQGGSLNVALSHNNQDVILRIADTGPGIPLKYQDKVFDPFFTTKKSGNGTGLGLSIVYSLVKQLHGQVRLTSEPGNGTTFKISFPIDRKSSIVPEVIPPSSFKGNGKILLIDDEISVAETFKEALEQAGYEVICVDNGARAFELISHHDFDLLLTDYAMPKMTGLDLAKKVHQILPELPLLLMTGYSELTTSEEISACGIRQCLQKPLRLNQLTRAVAQHIG